MWYLIVLIPDLCLLSYFVVVNAENIRLLKCHCSYTTKKLGEDDNE